MCCDKFLWPGTCIRKRQSAFTTADDLIKLAFRHPRPEDIKQQLAVQLIQIITCSIGIIFSLNAQKDEEEEGRFYQRRIDGLMLILCDFVLILSCGAIQASLLASSSSHFMLMR